MADEEYGSYGGRRYNEARDDEEEESRPSYGESGMSGRYNRPSSRKDTDRTMDEPDPVVPTEGYSLESTYGKKADDDSESTASNPSGLSTSFHKPSKPVGAAGTMDEPDPAVPTQGYSIDSTYGSSKLSSSTDAEDSEETPSGYGSKPSATQTTGGYGNSTSGSYNKPSKPVGSGAGTMDEPDPVVPTQGYNIDSTYGSGKFKTDADDSADTSGYGRKPTGYSQSGSYKKPTAGATMDEPDPVEPTQGYCIDSTYGGGYGSGKKDDDESDENAGYGGKKTAHEASTYGYGKKNDEDSEEVSGLGGRKTSYGEESEESTGYGRPSKTSAHKPSTYGRDEAETVVPTVGYNLESTYGVEGDESRKPYSQTGYRSKKDDEESEFGGRKSSYGEDSESTYGRRTDDDDDRKPKHGKKKHGDDDEESGYRRPAYGRQEINDSDDEDKKSSYKKHGLRRGDVEENEEDSEESGGSKYGATRYGRKDDEELVSSTAGLSLDSEGYSRGDSENTRRGDDGDDNNRRGKHGHHPRKHDDDED